MYVDAESRQPLAPREIGKPRDLKGNLAPCEGGLCDSDEGPHLPELCFNKTIPDKGLVFDK